MGFRFSTGMDNFGGVWCSRVKNTGTLCCKVRSKRNCPIFNNAKYNQKQTMQQEVGIIHSLITSVTTRLLSPNSMSHYIFSTKNLPALQRRLFPNYLEMVKFVQHCIRPFHIRTYFEIKISKFFF